jgi:hypothetical protein
VNAALMNFYHGVTSIWGWTMDILKWNGNALWMKRIHRHVYKAVSDVVYVNRRHL